MSKLKAITTLIVCFLFLTTTQVVMAAPINTRSVIAVNPVLFNISLKPGSTQTFSLKITNLTDTPLPVTARFDKLETPDATSESLNGIASLTAWATIDAPDMIIPAREERTLRLTLTIPKTVPFGGYYGMLFLKPLLSPQSTTGSLVAAEIGVVMLGNVGVIDPNAKRGDISRFSFDSFFYEEGPIRADFRVKNTSLSHFSAKPLLTLQPLFGTMVTVPVEEKFVFPGKNRSWTISFTLPNYLAGPYRATLAVSTGNGNQITTGSYIFAFPIRTVGFVLILILCLVYAFKKRKKLIKALTILIRGS